MRSQKEGVVRQRQFGMPTKNVTKKERAEEARSEQSEPETGRYLLQVDRQTKRSFNTPEAAQSAAMEIKTRFPALQVSIYDDVTKSRTVVDAPGSSSQLN
jgi:hypothetical protein